MTKESHSSTKSLVKPRGRGGARPGAGRPPKEHPDTVPRRVPWEHKDRVQELVEVWEIVERWKTRARSGKGPRWEKLKKMLEEMPDN
jgi:hypothetical protein